MQAWLAHFGAERLTLAFDVSIDDGGLPRVMTHGWQRQSEYSLWDAVDNYSASQLKHVLCTDVGRDGALTGPNVDLYREAVRRYPHIEWQASGAFATPAICTPCPKPAPLPPSAARRCWKI